MANGQIRHFLDLTALDKSTLRLLIDSALERKKGKRDQARGALDTDAPLGGHILALVFEKSSTRTRASFDVGMRQLGGEVLALNSNDMQLGRGETVEDTAQVLARFVDVIMLRTTAHQKLLDFANASSVPVINGLTDFSHPCQLMADIMTFEEHRGPIKDRVMTWVGDGNNVAHSFIHAAVQFDFELRLACPDGYHPDPHVMAWAKAQNGRVHLTTDAKAAAENSACIVTDTWVSMGDKDAEARHKALGPYQVNKELMALADKDAIFMHCLPAHRGEEVTAEVMDGPQSVVFDEAENRLHAQKAILVWCLSA